MVDGFYYIQRLQIILMHQTYQWRENDYEPGLFTFYKDKESLDQFNIQMKPPKKREIIPQRNTKRFKLRTKSNTKRYATQCIHQSIQKSCEKPKKVISRRGNYSQMKKNRFIIENVQQDQNDKKKQLLRTRTQLKMKQTSMNDNFKYDRTKHLEKIILYREQSRERQQEKNLPPLIPYLSTFRQSRQSAKTTLYPKSPIKIPENKPRKPQGINIYCNFVQYMVQKRKRQIKEKLDVTHGSRAGNNSLRLLINLNSSLK